MAGQSVRMHRGYLVSTSCAILIFAALAAVVCNQPYFLDQFGQLKSWDSYTAVAMQLVEKGERESAVRLLKRARSEAQGLSQVIPYRQVAENQLGLAALSAKDEVLASEYFIAVRNELGSYLSSVKRPFDDTSLVVAHEYMIASDRLGYLALKAESTEEASKFFADSLALSDEVHQSGAANVNAMPFADPRARDLLGLIEVARRQDQWKEVSRLFFVVQRLDRLYPLTPELRKPFNVFAQELRVREGITEPRGELLLYLRTARKLPLELQGDHLIRLLNASHRTKDDNCALLYGVTALVARADDEANDALSTRVLLAAAHSKVPVEMTHTALLQRLAVQLDAHNLKQDSIGMLQRCIEEAKKLTGVNDSGSARLLYDTGVRELSWGHPKKALEHLTQTYTVYSQSFPLDSKEFHGASVAYARALVANKKFSPAFPIVLKALQNYHLEDDSLVPLLQTLDVILCTGKRTKEECEAVMKLPPFMERSQVSVAARSETALLAAKAYLKNNMPAEAEKILEDAHSSMRRNIHPNSNETRLIARIEAMLSSVKTIR